MTPSPWEHSLFVLRHHYYDLKPAFERESDIYAEWAAFAVEQGEFNYRIGEDRGEAAAGQLVVCPPGTPFGRHTEEPISFHYFLFHWLDDHGRPIPATGSPSSVRLRFQNAERVHASLATLRTPAFADHPTYRLWRNHILLDLFRLYAMEEDMPPAAVHRQVSSDSQMEAARNKLDNVCEEPSTIGSIAAALSMSAVQFTRQFRRSFGVTPARYVETVKLDKVCHLLTHTGMTIEQIALVCGFNNGFYLSRYFSLKMKLSPSEYRRIYKV